MNTYGLGSINRDTFNVRWGSPLVYPKPARNVLVTLLKMHNLTLNILGYIPGISLVSGCTRIGTGLTMCAITLAVGNRDAMQGAIIGHWYDEALLTGITQIARGTLEAFVPFGMYVNASLDVVATLYNFGHKLCSFDIDSECALFINIPHRDPKYPFIFKLLHLA